MPLKTIYVGFNLSFWVDVATRLADDAGWQPTYWVGRDDLEPRVTARFPEVVYHSLIHAIRGIYPPGISPASLDQPFLREFSGTEVDTLKMMDRMSALDSFGYLGRERLYYRQLMYWRAVIEQHQPDLVVFGTIPHLIYDYLLYALCQKAGIRTVMFESTPMRGLVFLMDRFDGESRAARLYQEMLLTYNHEPSVLRPETEAYLQTLRGNYDQVPAYMRRAYKEELPGRQRSTLGTTLKKLVDLPAYGRYFRKQRAIITQKFSQPRSYHVKKGQQPEQDSYSRVDDTILRWRAKRYMRRLEVHYHQRAVPVDLDRPYIYVGLSFQPERTSSPMAGVYVNQWLMVDLLAKSVPQDWLVYVKEHPTQFTPSMNFRSQSGRAPVMYDDLAAIPNVRLVPMTTPSFDLTDHARAIATVTGSVGWEAINRGKPVLLFGHPWYRGCEGTFQIDSQSDCVNALQQIESGLQINYQKVRLFVHAIEQVGIEGYVEPHLKIANISEQENAALIAGAIREFWETSLNEGENHG